MEKLIYNFLDNYYGDEVYVVQFGREYVINSSKGGKIVSFIYWESSDGMDERISLHGNSKVCEMIGSFFSIHYKEASNYIRDWFGDKHNLKKVSDIKKFIPA